jgi:hypothetical protein
MSTPQNDTMVDGIQRKFYHFPPGFPGMGPPTFQFLSSRTKRESMFLEIPGQPDYHLYMKDM